MEKLFPRQTGLSTVLYPTFAERERIHSLLRVVVNGVNENRSLSQNVKNTIIEKVVCVVYQSAAKGRFKERLPTIVFQLETRTITNLTSYGSEDQLTEVLVLSNKISWSFNFQLS